jgi:AcrR family transcriptional regulator
MTPSEVVDAARRIGRPRSTECDRAILDAAIEVFVEQGYDALTMEGVATRAAVGKATVYRRYPTKLDRVMAAAEQLGERKGPIPDTGAVRGDLLALGRNYRRFLTGTDTGRAIPAMVAAKARCAELADAHSRYVAQRHAASTVVIERAIARGELPRTVDAGLVVEMVFAPLFHRVLVSGLPVPDAYLERLVDTVLAGARAAS